MCAAFLAAFVLLGSLSNARLWPWLSTKTMDELYGLLNWALWAVIIGVLLKNSPFSGKGGNSLASSGVGEVKKAFSKAWLHKGEIAEGVGFIILVIGLAGELALDPLIENRQKATETNAAHDPRDTERQNCCCSKRCRRCKRQSSNCQRRSRPGQRARAALEKQAADSQRDAEKLV